MIFSVHPFPARMAADIALRRLARLPENSLVLDPMAGSGTVLRAATEQGHRALGFDVDPLAVLMSKALTTPINPVKLLQAAQALVGRARQLGVVAIPWIDEDNETRTFIDYWFGKRQQEDLRKLSALLQELRGAVSDALRVGLSRTIITKNAGAGASLAGDVSHSRPHRVLDSSDFCVLDGFVGSVERLAQRLEARPPQGHTTVKLGDARCLSEVESGSVDAVITSPPYLNAIDYLRGHRLSLVWLGYRVGQLRSIRAESVGAERAPASGCEDRVRELLAGLDEFDRLPARLQGMLRRYALDLESVLGEAYRVTRPGGFVILVVGDSTLRGVFIRNSMIVKAAARRAGLCFRHQAQRDLPAARRYLPPPDSAATALNKRMQVETVITFCRPPGS